MGKNVFIAEKPSVAQAFANALGIKSSYLLADEDVGKDAYVDSLMSLVRPMRDRGRLVPAAQEFMDFLDRTVYVP